MWNAFVDALAGMIGPGLALFIAAFMALGVVVGGFIIFGPLLAIAGLPHRKKHGLKLREEEANLPHYHAH
jgi:hypothetical protein